MVLEKTLESPLDCKRSNQSILKEITGKAAEPENAKPLRPLTFQGFSNACRGGGAWCHSLKQFLSFLNWRKGTPLASRVARGAEEASASLA